MTSTPPGMITVADAPLLAAYCSAVAQHKAAVEAMNADRDLFGKVNLINPTGKPSPYLKIIDQAARTMASLSTRLGLSPADRTGIKITATNVKPGSKWDGLIG